MKQYLLAVHIVEGESAPSEAEMQQAYKSAGRTGRGGGLHLERLAVQPVDDIPALRGGLPAP
jgi:hypothetical protein